MATLKEKRDGAVEPSRKGVVDAFEGEIKELRLKFDLYIRGMEKFPPTDMWADVKRRVAKARLDAARWNTVDKFRMNSVHQKFLTYDRMWEREMKAVEEGTSRRDKMRKEKARREENAAEFQAAKRGPARPKASEPGMGDEKMKRLYSVYMQAKKRTGENTNLSFDGLKKQLEKQIPKIKQKHGCNQVDFKVVLKNGKAMLKAVPK